MKGRAGSMSRPGSKVDPADPTGRPYPWYRDGRYWLATAFFLLALLSKSLTATLPCALMVA